MIIEDVYPVVDGGRYAVKRVAGETVDVWADIFRDGHAVLAADLLWRDESAQRWSRAPMEPQGNDRWHGSFQPTEPGRYVFAIEAWTDQFATWRRDFLAKQAAGLKLDLELQEGLLLINSLLPRIHAHARKVRLAAERFESSGDADLLISDDLAEAARSGDQGDLLRSRIYPLVVDRPIARASAWYEIFPRSQSDIPGTHGTLADCINRVPEIAALGFDVLYLTPIHPIGQTNRKGRNNALQAGPDDPGSPYAIGSSAGGHDARASAAWHRRGCARAGPRLRGARHGDRARLRHSVLAGSSLADRTSRMVPATARRLDPICREPAEEIRGHRQSGFLRPGQRRALGGAARRPAVLEQHRGSHLPGRQSAHQAVPVLGVGHPRSPVGRSRRHVPVGSVHPPEGDEGARQARLHPVVHLFHLADRARKSCRPT